MKSDTVPLAMSEDLLEQVRNVARQNGLSMADAMRQSMRIGLPKLAEKLSIESGRVTNVDPLPDKVMDRIYAEREKDKEGIKLFMAPSQRGQSKSLGIWTGQEMSWAPRLSDPPPRVPGEPLLWASTAAALME